VRTGYHYHPTTGGMPVKRVSWEALQRKADSDNPTAW
jgi:hypothetical protein